MISRVFYKSILKSAIIIVLVSIILFMNITDKAFANYYVDKYTYTGSWTEKADKSIYGKDSEIQYEDVSNNGNEPTEKKVGFVEDLLIKLVMSITDGLYFILEKIGITIDNVIYGRVGGHTKNGIALFRFELQKGNPYGVVASVIYNVVAGIAIIFLVISLFGRFSFAMSYSTGRKWSDFKSSIGISLISMALISLMPYFLDLALYLADVILYTVSRDGSLQLFASVNGFNIVDEFRNAAKSGIVDSLIYLSTIILSLYFAAIYVGYALSMVVLFISFPAVCVGMSFDKKLISQWGKQVLSIILIPIMDCILMMIPIYFGLLPGSASMSVIKIFVCAMVVPSRNIIRQLLGLGGSGLELTGVATMLGAAKLAGAAGSAIQKYRGGRKAAKEDENMANYYSELAMNEPGGNRSVSGISTGSGGIMQSAPGISGANASPSVKGGAASTGDVSYMGQSIITPDTRSADKYANINNFENFKGTLSHEKMAEMYKMRAAHRKKTGNLSALGSVAGGALGMGSGIFMGAGFSTHMGALGMAGGGALGDLIANHNAVGSSPDPELYPQPGNATNENVEHLGTFQGEVDMDTAMQDMSGVQTEATAYKSRKNQTVEFLINNRPIAENIANNKASEILDNNGEELKIIYNDVMKENNNKVDMGYDAMSNNQIRNEVRNRAADKVIIEFRTEFNKSAKRENDEMANQAGLAGMSKYTDSRFRNMDNGYLSEDILDTFDWMPRRDKEGDFA